MIAPIKGLTSVRFNSDTITAQAGILQYTLSHDTSTDRSFVYISGVFQEPIEAYSIEGTTITFTAVPPTGSKIVVRYLEA